MRPSKSPVGANRAQRRATGRQQSAPPDPLVAGLQTIHREAGGALELYVVEQADAVALIIAAGMGSTVAATLLDAAERLTKQTRKPHGERPLCIACPAELPDMQGVRIGLAVPHRAHPTMGVAFALCPGCALTDDGSDKVLSGLRRIWPEMRRVVVTHSDGGRA